MKNEERHIEFRSQVVRYLAGEMTVADQQLFEDMVAADVELQKILSDYSDIWNGVDRLAARNRYDMDAEWSLLSGKLDMKGVKISPTGRIIRLRTALVRIAAAVLIGLVGVAGWYSIKNYTSYEQIAQEEGIGLVELADGSKVTLNAGSTIKYVIDEKSQNRKVILTGEAYFEIARDTARPFIIDAGSAVIEVLGTSFNVKAYKDRQTVEVTVNSGLVSMSSKRDSDQQIILNPGNSGIYNKKVKQLDLLGRADPNAIAWKTRELVFDETPLSEVIKVISHVYRVNIQLSGEEIMECPITVTFSNQEFEAVLNVLVNTLDLEVDRKQGEFILTGPGCN